VAADEADIVAERQQLVGDRLDQRGVIAAGNVAAADEPLNSTSPTWANRMALLK